MRPGVPVEVQGQADKAFPQRMFTYYSRLFDRYQRPITAFAILSDKIRSFHPNSFEQEFLGTRLSYQFNTYKILNQSVAELEASENPFSTAILTVLAALQKKQVDETELLTLKLDLARRLLGKPFSKSTIRALMNFLPWRLTGTMCAFKNQRRMLFLKQNTTSLRIERELWDF
jgi:hypothetical protein